MGKIKIHEIAKELNIENKEDIEIANKLGMNVKSHLNAIDEKDAEKIKEEILKKDKKEEVKTTGQVIIRREVIIADEEEKEKKTLRVLMTSSVNGLEFFIGSILPPFLVTAALNYVLIPLSGCAIGGAGLAVFTVVTLLSSLASCIIGMLLGIFTKDQVSAGTLISPVLLVLMFVPMFSSLFEPLEYISRFLFTGIIMDTAMELVIEPDISVDMLGLVVLALETVAAAALFVVFYRRNGYEKD